jgi:hypothetical protein
MTRSVLEKVKSGYLLASELAARAGKKIAAKHARCCQMAHLMCGRMKCLSGNLYYRSDPLRSMAGRFLGPGGSAVSDCEERKRAKRKRRKARI